MKNSEGFGIIAILICTPVVSFCSAAARSEPNAFELVRAVRESENWLHRIDSLRLRIEGKWTRSPEYIARKRDELEKQYPDQELDPNRHWDLKPSFSDILEYVIDFKGQRLRYFKDTRGESYFLGIWDGKKALGYSDRSQQYYLDSDKDMFETLFGSISWTKAQPHSFWWEPQNIEESMKYFGRAEDFKITGRQEYRGIMCYVLECTSYLDPPVTRQWYVGIEDHLLYGRREWIKPEAVFEYWTLDYKQVAPGCRLPMTQGYSLPTYNPDTKKHYIQVVRDVKIVEARVNETLDEELFEMKFEEGLAVIDRRSGKTVVYNYISTLPSLIGKPLPDFENIKIDFDPDQAKDRMLLVCFWDMNQRPSRNCIIQLSTKLQEMKEKEVVVIAVHASKIEQEKLDDWIRDNEIDLPVGLIADQEKKIRFNWGVKSLPWLILTGGDHIIRAEGFNINELDAKIVETQNAVR